jgi:hypothetical protein
MQSRLKLHEVLCGILGTRNVYFNPPESVKMRYPAIVYSRSVIDNKHANNAVYNQEIAYDVTVVDPDPDSEVVQAMSKLPLCRFVRHYTADNLNHDVFTLYF